MDFITELKKISDTLKETLKLKVDCDSVIDGSFKSIIVPGVWDRLHSGHIETIKKAFEKGVKVTVAILREANDLNNSEFREIALPLETRKKVLVEALDNYLGKKAKYDLIEIEDDEEAVDLFAEWARKKKFDGCMLADKDLNHIGSVKRINEIRKLLFEDGVVIPKVIVVKSLKDEEGNIISSSKIRSWVKQEKIKDKEYFYK